MKTVSGQVTSTKTISVSKAAKALSNFIAAETGASRAVSAYLRRASAEFIDLVQFHKELKASKYDRKLKKHAQESTDNEDPVNYGGNPEEYEVGWRVEDLVGSDSGRKRHKKKKGVKVEGMSTLEEKERTRREVMRLRLLDQQSRAIPRRRRPRGEKLKAKISRREKLVKLKGGV